MNARCALAVYALLAATPPLASVARAEHRGAEELVEMYGNFLTLTFCKEHTKHVSDDAVRNLENAIRAWRKKYKVSKQNDREMQQAARASWRSYWIETEKDIDSSCEEFMNMYLHHVHVH